MTDHYLSPALSGLTAPSLTSSMSGVEALIHNRIWNAVLDRKFRPGTKLPELEIGDMFNVSRTVVRKVLVIMEQEGIVTLPLNRGAYIMAPTEAETREVLETLSLISEYLIRQIVGGSTQSLSDADRELLRTHYDTQRKMDEQNFDGSHRLAVEFFALLAHLHGNRILGAMQGRNIILLSQALMLYQKAAPLKPHHEYQRPIIDAIDTGRSKDAIAGLKAYLSSIEDSLRFSKNEGKGFQLRSILLTDGIGSVPVRRGRGRQKKPAKQSGQASRMQKALS